MGRLPRDPEQRAEPRERQARRSDAVALTQPQTPEGLGVGLGGQAHPTTAQLAPEEEPLDHSGVEHRHTAGEHLDELVDGGRQRWRVGEVGGTQLVNEHGAVGRRARNPDELGAALKASFAAREPTLIEVPVGPMPSPWEFIHMPRVRGK